MNTGKVLLAIESAISGGSIALLRDDTVLTSFTGETGVSRAEDLLPNLATLLQEAGVARTDIGTIAVSIGPGSFTGLRIGISTVLGLKAALNTKCVGVKLFDAIQPLDAGSAIAIPLGKHDICLRKNDREKVVAVPISELPSHLKGIERILVHRDILETVANAGTASIQDIGRDLAVHIGRYARNRTPSEHLEPIYIQSPRFI